ncbi:MAG: RNA polymerase sigma factor [Bacteroidota bacterium]
MLAHPITESQLIAGLLAGNGQAIQLLIDTYKNRVFNTILGMVQNTEDAEELAQDVFIKALQNVEKFKGQSQISTWLYRIAINTSLDHLKMRSRKKRFAFMISLSGGTEENPAPNPPDFVHPGLQLENKELAQTLFKAINQLAEKQKTALVLTKIEGLSYEQTAQVMETTIAAVESLLFRAKQNLKKIMSNYLDN